MKKISRGQQKQIDIQKNISIFRKNMKENNPTEEVDLEDRLNKFNAEMEPILKKYELALASIMRVLPDGRLSDIPVAISTRKKVEPNIFEPSNGIVNPDK